MFLTCFSVECISRDDPRIVDFNDIKTFSEKDGLDVTYLNDVSQINKSDYWNYLDDSDPFRLEITTKDNLKEGIEDTNNNMDSVVHLFPPQSDGPKTTLQKCAFINSGKYQKTWIYPFVNVCNSSDKGHSMDKYQTLLETTTELLTERVQNHEISLHQLHQFQLEIIHYKYLLLFYNQQVSFILYILYKFVRSTLIL